MKKHLFTIIIVMVFLAGLTVLLYPLVSDYINARNQSRAVARYFEDVSGLSAEEYDALMNAAHEYNQRLLYKGNRFVFSDEDLAEYMDLLNFSSNGVMGVLEIEKIDVRLPIYHGTDESALQIGAGHFEGTSLPVGGPGNHAVVTGHRGLPSSTLLTNMDRLIIGDVFRLHILDEILTYEIDQIIEVLPHELDALSFVPGKDYVTLITCTPYGINSHRMMVRGQRLADAEQTEIRRVDASLLPTETETIGSLLVALALISPVLVFVMIRLAVRLFKMRGG